MTEQRETLPDGRTARLRVTRLDCLPRFSGERGLPERLEQITYSGAAPGPTAERDHTAYAYDAAGQRILKRSWSEAPQTGGLPGQQEPVYAVERYVRDGQRLVGAFDGEGTLLWWTLGGMAGLEGRLVPQPSGGDPGGPIIDGPKALTESYTRLATAADTVLVGALVAAGLDVSSAEAVAEQASPSVVYHAQQAASGAVEAAEEGAALGMTDAGGREQHGQTQGAITEALRLALLAEGYDALAADTLSQAAGVEASVGLAQVVGSAVGEAKAGPGITYGRRYYVADHLGSVRAVVDTTGSVVEGRDYAPWGLVMPGRVYVQGSETREGFTGHELDRETGLVYAGARYYLPALGRWTSVDPLADEFPGWSPYNYVMNSPVGLVDPDGNEPVCPECSAGRMWRGAFSGVENSFYEAGSALGQERVRTSPPPVYKGWDAVRVLAGGVGLAAGVAAVGLAGGAILAGASAAAPPLASASAWLATVSTGATAVETVAAAADFSSGGPSTEMDVAAPLVGGIILGKLGSSIIQSRMGRSAGQVLVPTGISESADASIRSTRETISNFSRGAGAAPGIVAPALVRSQGDALAPCGGIMRCN